MEIKNEQRFYSALKELFVGQQMEGKSGYINLMNIKSEYFDKIQAYIKKEIDALIKDKPAKEELFQKLYTFFDSYFNETGTPFYAKTQMNKNLYEKIYSEREDVTLFWKTQNLYYVKSEVNYSSIENMEVDGMLFDFDASNIEHQKSNEKKELEFYLTGATNKKLSFKVLYIDNSRKKFDRLKEYLKCKTPDDVREKIASEIYKLKHPSIRIIKNGLKVNKDDTDFIKNNLLIVNNDDTINSVDIEVAISDIKDNVRYLIDNSIQVDEESIKHAFSTYRRQNEIDYFIHNDAERFLKGQFDSYLYNYLFGESNLGSEWSKENIDQVTKVKKIAHTIIEFIARLEDELKLIWEKPKFVRKSQYVISLVTLSNLVDKKTYDKIEKAVFNQIKSVPDYKEDVFSTIKETLKRPLQKVYVKKLSIKGDDVIIEYLKIFEDKKDRDEYAKTNKCLKIDIPEIIDRDQSISGFFAEYKSKQLPNKIPLSKAYIDTCYFNEDFKGALLDAVTQSNDLDDVLSGYLIKSENYQALQTILPKFRERVRLIYIDPPFNTEKGSFAYRDKFKDSTWLTFIKNRLEKGAQLLSSESSFYIHLDHNCNYLGRIISDEIFNKNLKREIIWNTGESPAGFKTRTLNWIRQHDTILYYSIYKNPVFNKMWIKNEEKTVDGLGWLDVFKDDKENLYVLKYNKGTALEKYPLPNMELNAIGDVWNDIYSMMYTQNMTRENWGKDNTQKPENLLRRIIQTSSKEGDYVCDFFLGSGTTAAAAHKLNRKWIGIEMGDFFDDVILKRMKTVIFGDIRTKLSEDLQWRGGGFFKYYELEQYEDVLRNAAYNPIGKDIANISFQSGEKLLDALIIDREKEKVKIHIEKIYPDVDIAETISNLTGKKIKQLNKKYVIFDDGDKGEKIVFDEMTYEKYPYIKPLLWWKSR